ncbi:unnamed protein product (macronuclear) [Paramecium tetraurelia]|uniref:Uncharacterized protein n=1 Tax=Paramecium tetraurelia TaxID=5888 RepID=A0BYE6_PARTE|nr:uncharacterized protein GSPATT00033416001 [Paramecium tetraurelia]CAK63563.1 unnamed protein product [Paramecium tetraurelia]|eukprot:XP_001430961.1 hypothetical protein (macronuclear) [Paramecium tetraurelia strain d4-2]
MFRRVFGISNRCTPTRLRYLREYVCLREAANPSAQQAQIAQFQQVSNKYGLAVPQLATLSGIFQLSQLLRPQNFPNPNDYKIHVEKLELLFRQSQQSNETLSQFAQSLEFKIPEIAKLTNDARKQAAQELFSIYLEGIHYDNLVSPGYVEQLESIYRQRTKEAAKKIQAEVKDPQLATQLIQSLESILENYQFHQGRYVGLIKSFIDTLQGTEVQVTQKLDQQTQEKQLFIQTVDKATKKFSAEDQEYARNVDGHDYKLFLQELYEKEYQSGFAQNRFNEKGQKLVYESQAQEHHVLRYQILAGVFAGYFLYLFYRGDAYYSTIQPSSIWLSRDKPKRAIPFVRQVLKNTDNTYEVVFEQNRIISRIENVQPGQIKLAQDTQFANALVLGNPTDFGYHVKVADNSFIAPYLYSGNGLDFRAFINV